MAVGALLIELFSAGTVANRVNNWEFEDSPVRFRLGYPVFRRIHGLIDP
jgi:hypothetical protein